MIYEPGTILSVPGNPNVVHIAGYSKERNLYYAKTSVFGAWMDEGWLEPDLLKIKGYQQTGVVNKRDTWFKSLMERFNVALMEDGK